MPKYDSETGTDPSLRQLRVGETIRRALADILMRSDLHDPDLDGATITVGEVRCSPDLKHATAFILPLGGQDAERILAALIRAASELRRHLNPMINLKFSPQLHFQLDDTFDRMDDTRRMLGQDRVRRDLD